MLRPLFLLGLMIVVGITLVFGGSRPAAHAAPAQALPANFKIVAYLTSWSGSSASVQYSRITHLNYAFVLPNANGSLQTLENPSKLQDAVSRSHAAGVKVLISVGGWNNGNDSAFESLAGNATARNAFINNMVNMVNTYNLDGVDIDWEYPDPGASATNYAILMRDLSTAMHSRGKLLTAAVVSGGTTANGVLPEVFGYVDFLNIMTYDGGSPHANYSWAVSNVSAWMSRGLPASKTVMGVPFYASPGGFSYAQAAAAGFQNQDCATVNGVYGCYNGIPTIQQKTQYMANKGGIMFWEISQDATGSASLLTTIYNTANTQPPVTPPATTPPPTTPPPTPSGTNLALNKPATSSSNESASYPASNAFDGNAGTRWSSAFSQPQWVRVDLGATYTINRVYLSWEAAYGSGYQIQVSNDGNTWTTIYSTTSGNGGIDDLTGLSGSGRYVRMNGTARATQYGFSLWEIQVYGTGGSNPTPTPTTPAPGGINTSAWYSLRARHSSKCVDARASGTANGTVIQQYACNNGYAQQFQFQLVSGNTYRIANRNNTNALIDVAGQSTADGGLIQLWAGNGQTNQQWQAVSLGGGYYRFISVGSGKCLDVPAGSTADSLQLQQWTCNTTLQQQFSLVQQP